MAVCACVAVTLSFFSFFFLKKLYSLGRPAIGGRTEIDAMLCV